MFEGRDSDIDLNKQEFESKITDKQKAAFEGMAGMAMQTIMGKIGELNKFTKAKRKELLALFVVGSMFLAACSETQAKELNSVIINNVTPEVEVISPTATARPVEVVHEKMEKNDLGVSFENSVNSQAELEEINGFFHKQMDKNEYTGKFAPILQKYFGENDIRFNFCGPMTLTNVLDIMSDVRTGKPYGMEVPDLVNKYFIDKNGNIAPILDNGLAFYGSNGSMTPTALYWIAEKIGSDTGLWNMDLVYGTKNFERNTPVRKTELEAVVQKAKEEVFDKGGVLIMHIGRRKYTTGKETSMRPDMDVFDYYHYLTILDMKMNPDGSAEMLVVDSMGRNQNGYVGWVNSEAFTIPWNETPPLNAQGEPMERQYDPNVFTGIYNMYGVVPNS